MGTMRLLKMNRRKPGGRFGTSMAQRNASRKNIRKAQLVKRARTVKY